MLKPLVLTIAKTIVLNIVRPMLNILQIIELSIVPTVVKSGSDYS